MTIPKFNPKRTRTIQREALRTYGRHNGEAASLPTVFIHLTLLCRLFPLDILV